MKIDYRVITLLIDIGTSKICYIIFQILFRFFCIVLFCFVFLKARGEKERLMDEHALMCLKVLKPSVVVKS